MLPRLYYLATWLGMPLVGLYMRRRLRRGKEDAARFGERHGLPGQPRPAGPLLWVHAASVGEATSVLRLIEKLIATRPALAVLVTTGTVASARLLETRLPARTRHQYVPVDLPGAVARFLDHWRPDLGLWVESELWPNLVLMTQAKGVPMALLNGRLSPRSYARWRRLPGLIRPVLQAFALCLAQDEAQAQRLRRLGAPDVAMLGDLKASASALPVDAAEMARLPGRIGSRPCWLAASTHPGEEEIAAEVHRRLAADHPGLLTIIAPRHPGRADAIAAMLAARGLRCARRSHGETPDADTGIWLADTIGELGLFYRLAVVAFIGGSLAAKGGHNPLEAARLDCAILHGPDMSSCAAIAAELAEAGAAETVTDASALAQAVAALLADPRLRAARAAAAAQVAGRGTGMLDRVLAALAPWLDRLAPVASIAEPRRA
jgi:3-deoxy-D-manno-octulosonic-acid transferase